jgi:PAS domain S-box-containing protein
MGEKKFTEEIVGEIGWEHRALTEILRDVVWTMGLDGRFTYVSPAITAQTGYKPEEYLSLSVFEVLAPESARYVSELVREQLSLPAGQRVESILLELQQKRKTGAVVDIEVNASWIYDSAGNPAGMIGVTRDISARKQAEAALRESEERFRAFFSLSSEGIVLHENGVIVDANQAAAAMFGFPNPEALIGRQALNDIPFSPETKQALAAQINHPQLEVRDGEILRPDGKRVRVLIRGGTTMLRGHPVRIASLVDVTDLYDAEQALRDSESKFRTIGISAPDALILINDEGLVEYWNPAAERMFGYTAMEMQGIRVHDKIMPEAFRPRFEKAFRIFREIGAGEAIGKVIELTAKRKDGSEFPIEIAVNPISMKGRYWSSAIIRDITERRRTEEERALNARRTSVLLELNQMTSASIHDLTHFAMEEAVRLTGSAIGYVAFTNEEETVLTMYSWSKAAMEGCAIEKKPVQYSVDTTGLWGEAVRQRRPVITNNYAADNPWKKGLPEGHVPIVRHMNVPIFDGDHIVLVAGVGNKPEDYDEGDVRHLTLLMEGMWRIVHQRQAEEERKLLQEQLAQASKMEAVGQLAGGVAHDFNNLLTTILGYSEMILEQLAKDSPVRAEVEEISKAGARAASLTQQLLAFSRKQVIMPRPIDLNETVKEARNMLERLIGENIRLVLSLDPDPGRVKADPHQIDQVLLNLAVNARDAMPDGGVLTVATANVAVEKDHAVARSEIVPGNYVVLSVADTGIGMDKETRARIFEPFFSTKEFGKGTGLGLATVYGIAKQNGGTVLVDSEPGRGSVFRIYLPRLYTAGAAVNPASARTASPTGNETILLVEDDAMVQRLAQKMLNHLGYEVLPAQDTEDAVRICETHPRPIHLLLTDVIMPRMNGVELYSQLQTLRPGMKALFMSGYAEDVVARKGVLPEGTEFIHKPFDMENLALRIRQTLEM